MKRIHTPARFLKAAAAAAAAGLVLFQLAIQPLLAVRAAGTGWDFTPTAEIYLALVLNRPSLGDVDHLLITEVMYAPSESQEQVEWVEIFNPTGEVIDLGAYKLGDEETLGGSEGMYRFPSGSQIGVGQTIVIARNAFDFLLAFGFEPDFEFSDTGSLVPDMLKYGAWATGSLTLTNTGDEVLLLDLFDDVVDAVSWGSSNWAFDPDLGVVPQGHSVERLPAYFDTDTLLDWADQSAPTPGEVDLSPPEPTPTTGPTSTSAPTSTVEPTATVGPSPTPFSGGLLISEVLYDPDGPEPAAEWFEIYNPTAAEIEIAGFKVGDEETAGGSEGMYMFPEGSAVPAGAAVVVANQAAQFEADYGWKPHFELTDTDPAVPDLVKYTDWSGGSLSLSNGGDELLLLDAADNLVDAVSWAGSVWAFDPPVPDVAGGHSIERFPPGVDTNTAPDWRDQISPSPGLVPAE